MSGSWERIVVERSDVMVDVGKDVAGVNSISGLGIVCSS